MSNKKLGLIFLFCTFSFVLSTVVAQSQIVIDPDTNTINIITSGSTDTGTVDTGTILPVNAVFTGTEFEQAQKRMFANGLTSYETKEGYRPDDYLTRQEAAKIIGQAYIVLGYEQTTKNSACDFVDTDIMDTTLVNHVANACKRGLFKGYQGNFMPFKALTRPEAMAVIVRMFEGKISFEASTPRRSDYYIKGRALGLTNLNSESAFETQITRYEIALYIFRLKNIVIDPSLNANALNALENLDDNGTGSTVAADFSAIAGSISVDKDPELREAIRWMNDNGLTVHKTIQDYLPFEILSREQSAKILVVFAEIFNYDQNTDIPLPAECEFSDTSSIDSSLKSYVEQACKSEILKGGAGKFMPKGTISKSQFVTALIRMFEGGKLDETTNPRWKNYFEEAQEMGIVSPADAITFDNPITRYEVALFLYRFKVKYQMINNLNTNKLENEIINTVPGSIVTGSNGFPESNIYADMNLLQNGNFSVGYIEILGSRYKVVKSSTEKYFSDNFVRYGNVFDLSTDDEIGTVSFIISNGYLIDGTVRLPDTDYLISQLSDTNAYYKINQIR